MVLMFIQEIRTWQQRRKHAVFQNPDINPYPANVENMVSS